MPDAELTHALRDVTVFARIMPEQKLRIVTALKAGGAVVAMTGDGVNDAPSLKAADIGVAMGGRGTDVAREAASIVLLDDDFGSIVATVRLGRRIYDNLRKAISFILAVHVPIAGLALMPLLFGMPLIFGPVHIAFLEMVIDPVCSLVFEAEAEEDEIMERPPRPPAEPLFSAATVIWSLVQGTVVFAVTATIFVLAPGDGLSTDQVRGLTFAALIFAIVALILVDRSRSSSLLAALSRPNRALAVALPIVGALLGLTLFWSPARDLLGFGVLPADLLWVPPLAGLLVLLVLEAAKFFWRRMPSRVRTARAKKSEGN
jgi:Ca2+-transporting ATPase